MGLTMLSKALFSNIPNTITSVRLLCIPPLWLVWLFKLESLVGVVLLVCFLSDLLDGLLARKLKMITAMGARLDSLADHVLFPSMMCWLLIDKRNGFFGHETVLETVLLMYVLTIVIGLVKRRQFGGAHLFSSKVLGFGGYLFVIVTYIFAFEPLLFYIAAGSLAYFCLETSLYSFFPRLLENRMKCVVIGLIGKDVSPRFLEGLI